MGTTLVAGRDYTRMDAKNAPGVIIINQTLAREFWPGEKAVERQVNVNGSFPCTVFGVAADVRHDELEVPQTRQQLSLDSRWER